MPEATIAILMPTRFRPCRETQYALDHNVGRPFTLLTEVGKPVDDARNNLVKRVLELNPRPDVCVWVDDDCYFEAGIVTQLLGALAESAPLSPPDLTVVAPVFGARANFNYAIASCRDNLHRSSVDFPLRAGVDFPFPALLKVELLGGHMFVHRPSLFQRLRPDPFEIPPGSTDLEDFAFARRVRAAGGASFVQCDAFVWHVGPFAGKSTLYCPGRSPAELSEDGTLREVSDPGPHVCSRSYGPAADCIIRKRIPSAANLLGRMRAMYDPRLPPVSSERARITALLYADMDHLGFSRFK